MRLSAVFSISCATPHKPRGKQASKHEAETETRTQQTEELLDTFVKPEDRNNEKSPLKETRTSKSVTMIYAEHIKV